jgi:peptidoglycan hydrolase-like protein with peptidoglycan-binding domain
MAGEPTLRSGESGEWVTYAQQLLAGFGYSLEADGQFGAAMEDAVRRFQESVGLQASGVIDESTWPRLNGEQPYSSADSGGTTTFTETGQHDDQGRIFIKLDEFPMLTELAQFQDGEQYLAWLGVERPSDDDTAIA